MGVQEFKVDLRRAKPARRGKGSPRRGRRASAPSFAALRESCARRAPADGGLAADWESWTRHARQTKCHLADGMVTDYVAADRGMIIGVVVQDPLLLDQLKNLEAQACDPLINVAKSLTTPYDE